MTSSTRLVAALAVIAAFIGGAGWQSANNERNADQISAAKVEKAAKAAAGRNRQRTIGSCNRGNISRANEIIDTQQPDDEPGEEAHQRLTEPVLDCEATARANGEDVPLPAAVQERFIELVRDDKRPIVKAAKIVDIEPFKE